jgi:hypothetical protein
MVTGDNVVTARAIARECGIVTSDSDVVIEGPAFRAMSPAQVDAILPRLKVMARSSPKDKNWLVRRLVSERWGWGCRCAATHRMRGHARRRALPRALTHACPSSPAPILRTPPPPQNGNLPRTAAEWELEHLSNDYTWDTAAALHGAEVGKKQPEGLVGELKIQDAVMPGYSEEWEARRKVRWRGGTLAVQFFLMSWRSAAHRLSFVPSRSCFLALSPATGSPPAPCSGGCHG